MRSGLLRTLRSPIVPGAVADLGRRWSRAAGDAGRPSSASLWCRSPQRRPRCGWVGSWGSPLGTAMTRRGWLGGQQGAGEGADQLQDLAGGLAAMAAQGARVGQLALRGPVADRLGCGVEQLGDFAGPQVRLGPRIGKSS